MDERQVLLDQLDPLRSPAVSPWPAIGWWLLAALLLSLMVGGLAWWRYQRRTRWRREAAMEIRSLREAIDRDEPATVLAGSSVLVRRLLLLARPRERVAGLHDEALLHTLDELCGQPVFSAGVGRLLQTAPYERAPRVAAADLHALVDTIELLAGSVTPQRSAA